MNNKLDVISEEADREMLQHIGEILQFLENSGNDKILYLLLLTDIEENARCIRFQTTLLSMIFHLESDGTQTEIDILAPYFEMVSRLKKTSVLGKLARKAPNSPMSPF